LSDWLTHHSRTLDVSRGFAVNRCALYWAGYDQVDSFDGQAFVDSCQDSRGSLNQLAQLLDTDLQIFELDPKNHKPKSADDLALAASYGMMGVEESTQLFMACSFGQGVEVATKIALDALNKDSDIENFMERYCGLDHAAMLGGAIACAMKGIPMILEGASGQLVKSLLETAVEKSFPCLILAKDMHVSPLPGHAMIANAIALKTISAGT